MKEKISKLLPFVTIGFVLIMAGSLCWGWLNPFFNGGEHPNVQGIDYFALPKSFLNLLEGRSAFDTFGGNSFGPYSTWYLAHPAFSVFVASWFSFLSPWVGYALFSVFSLLLIIGCAYLISQTTSVVYKKRLSYFILLCAFPTYSVLFSGNMHAPLVLALTLIMISYFEFNYGTNNKKANQKLFAGLLISLFTKPIVLLMLPMLLLLKETRKTTFKCLFFYIVVSLLFLIIPMFNPQGIGYNKLMNVMWDFDFIKQNMNIYKNNFVLNEFMKDNSIHWLNLIAQSDYKLMHIDVFSLPVFIDTLVGRTTPAGIYKIPIYISLFLSIAIAFIEDKKIRLESGLLMIMTISLTFFLSYNTVWEYQYSSALPIIALLPILKEKNVFYKKQIPFLFFTGLLFCAPSFYFLVRNGNYQNITSLTLIRLDKIIPALLLFLMMIFQLIVIVKKHAKFSKIKEIENIPSRLFFD